ncbi:spermidine/putrescine ABC transporter ATP-binding protein [Bacillus wudalianchiensis]|uniref:Spermidine/putrescine import ATP-binding protein PotA n=2 Tax=Pseudobacillus wudalianchiensis TaxID=1743143 RepID=A0A1B9B795_9BACI|nr:polyamine ABC transporter ATP-binding protein [Bacillus wudalianchiensis]OCA91929.1 spermidine/putrescine ABC transporter ATP-binding protein [Bacillus wudalianchiensis]
MVELKNVAKRFKDFVAAENINISVESGEFLTLLGPSGCGKTTTLRMIAGFEQPTEGEVWVNGQMVNHVEPYKRDVNTVFQSYALFPHMSVFNNIAYGLRMKKVPKSEIKERVEKILKLVQLEKFSSRKPHQLSGGQKQRVAIARALVNNPKVLLLDEPLGALDLKLRKQMQVELKHLQQELQITFVYVTHDQEEALTMSDRIIIMNDGMIEQIGSPTEIYERPKTRFIADFIGETNLFEGAVTRMDDQFVYVNCASQEIKVHREFTSDLSDQVSIAVRPEKMKILPAPDEELTAIRGILREKIYVGSVTKLIFEFPNGQHVTVNETEGHRGMSKIGDQLYIGWHPKDSVILRA